MRDAKPVTVLGIDPGTAVTGYGVVRKEGRHPLTLIECGVIANREQDLLLRQPAMPKIVSDAIATGIEQYFSAK